MMEHRKGVSVLATPCRVPACHRRGAYRRGLCYVCYADAGLRLSHAAPDARKPRRSCLHCGEADSVNRPRGLCWSCYYRPGVRGLYPPAGPKGYRGVAGDNRTRRTEPEPTTAPPGTVAKLEVLRLRAAMDQELWHPLDAAG